MKKETTYSRIVTLTNELILIKSHGDNNTSFDIDLTLAINTLNNIKKYF